MELVKFQGKEIEAEEVDVLTSTEGWNEYQLSDGSILSIKNVLVSVFRAKNEKSADGSVLYLANSKSIVKVKPTKPRL